MKSQLKKLDACNRQLDIEVGEDSVKAKLDEIYADIAKNAKIPGFRPGTAPREILEKHHSRLAQEEVVKALIPEAYQKSLDEHNLVTYAPADISDVTLKDNVLKFSAKVETRPQIELKDYKGINIKRKTPEVKEEDIEKQVQELAKERDLSGAPTESFAKSLGYATLDELKDTLRKQAYLHAQEHSYQELLNHLLTELVKNNPISAPKVLVKQQFERRMQELRYRVGMHGHKEEEAEAELKKLEPQLEAECEKDVRIFLLLEEIIKKENIKVKDQSKVAQRAIEFLLEHADWK